MYWDWFVILTDGVDDVVNLEDAPDGLAGEGDGAGADQERLHHVLLEDVGDGSFPHVDPRGLLSLSVSVPQLSNGACVMMQWKEVNFGQYFSIPIGLRPAFSARV